MDRKRKVLIFFSFFIFIIGGIFLMPNLTKKGNLVSPDIKWGQSSSQTPLPAAGEPTSTLIVIDAQSNLAEEIDKLTPPSFSQDFEKLKEGL